MIGTRYRECWNRTFTVRYKFFYCYHLSLQKFTLSLVIMCHDTQFQANSFDFYKSDFYKNNAMLMNILMKIYVSLVLVGYFSEISVMSAQTHSSKSMWLWSVIFHYWQKQNWLTQHTFVWDGKTCSFFPTLFLHQPKAFLS